jgi:hypothetical protein
MPRLWTRCTKTCGYLEDTTIRSNAILLQGAPVAHLPTNRIFAYATHFETEPLGLEWVNDNTCVLVFASASTAKAAFSQLQKALDDTPDDEGLTTARSIPMALWPAEERINASLGKGEGLRGVIRMRWARPDDVKKKGARAESKFYQKHGVDAGKDQARLPLDLTERIGDSDDGRKRRRGDDGSPLPTRAALDEELDAFLRDESPEEPEEPSKMRSDYISADGRSLLQRTSLMRAHQATLSDRVDPDSRWKRDSGVEKPARDRGDRRRGGDSGGRRREQRVTKSQQELDDELDAFLNERS